MILKVSNNEVFCDGEKVGEITVTEGTTLHESVVNTIDGTRCIRNNYDYDRGVAAGILRGRDRAYEEIKDFIGEKQE